MKNPFNSAQIRADQVSREAQSRFKKIAQKLLDVVSKEGVTVKELPEIVSIMTGEINKKFDEAGVGQILNLGDEEK